MLKCCLWLSLGGVLAFAQVPSGAKKTSLPFTCDLFSPTASAASLARRFGARNVTTGLVRVPEFDDEEGTILFASDPEARAEIYWLDATAKRGPERVYVDAPKSRWVSSRGIRIGMSVGDLERMNGRPMKLFFSDTDLGNSVMSWNGGRLADGKRRDGCSFGVSIDYGRRGLERKDSEWAKVFDGSGVELSSDHAGVKEMKPYVEAMVIVNDAPRRPEDNP